MTVRRPSELVVNRKIGYKRHHQSGGWNIDVAEEFAAVATAPTLIETAEVRRDFPVRVEGKTFADRAESGVQVLSRWAGILAFVGTVADRKSTRLNSSH